jgi:hypothetical protein
LLRQKIANQIVFLCLAAKASSDQIFKAVVSPFSDGFDGV